MAIDEQRTATRSACRMQKIDSRSPRSAASPAICGVTIAFGNVSRGLSCGAKEQMEWLSDVNEAVPKATWLREKAHRLARFESRHVHHSTSDASRLQCADQRWLIYHRACHTPQSSSPRQIRCYPKDKTSISSTPRHVLMRTASERIRSSCGVEINPFVEESSGT